MTYQQIQIERQAGIAWITLNRPEKLNALTPLMIHEWRDALEQLQHNETCQVIVVKGAGRAWSAGVDLAVFQESKVEPGFDMWEDGMAIMSLLENMPQPTIAMLNGFCFTGAMELMMAFDLVVAAEEAKIGDTHTKWGIPPKWGMTQRLQKLVGLRKAKELSFTARFVSGREAAEIGLVNRAVPLEQLADNVQELAQQIQQNSQQTIAAVKHLYQFGHTHLLPEGLEYEVAYQFQPTDKTDKLKEFKRNL